MRFDLRHRAVRIALLGAVLAGGTPALAAGKTSPVTGAAAAHPQKGHVKAGPAGATTPSAIPRVEKTAAATPAPAPSATPAAPPPATGPKTQSRRGRGAF